MTQDDLDRLRRIAEDLGRFVAEYENNGLLKSAARQSGTDFVESALSSMPLEKGIALVMADRHCRVITQDDIPYQIGEADREIIRECAQYGNSAIKLKDGWAVRDSDGYGWRFYETNRFEHLMHIMSVGRIGTHHEELCHKEGEPPNIYVPPRIELSPEMKFIWQ